MTREEAEVTWAGIVSELQTRGSGGALTRRLELLADALQTELFGERPLRWERHHVEPDDPRLGLLLDALGTLALLEPEDGSYPWDRALILDVVHRPLEAADDYLAAARLFSADAASGAGVLPPDDERQWAEGALLHAATCLARGGQPAAAAALMPRLAPDDRGEVEALLATS